MSEMVERVAEAIRGEISESDDIATWVHKENANKAARAAIEAMRRDNTVTSTPISRAIGLAMEREGLKNISVGAIWGVWDALIDAALA